MPSKTGSALTVLSNSGRKYVNIVLLNAQEIPLVVQTKSKVQDLFDQVCLSIGVKETHLFWLAVLRDGEYEFLDPKSKTSKYAPKGWKTDKVTDQTSRITFNLYFRVHLYVAHVSLIKEDITRQHYYLQLKQNVLSAPVLCQEEACFVLASYALQADHGDYGADTHRGQYFEPRKYFPEWVISRRGEAYITKHVPSMHRDQRGMTRVYAQRAYIREAANTIEHAMHFYRLKKMKSEQTPSIWLGISTRGMQLYEDSSEGKYLLGEYSWGIIKRLVLQKKRFELQVDGVADGRKITYYTSSEAKSKHLLRLCKLTHAFQMNTQAMVDRALKRESAAEKAKYRESYISGDVSWSDMDGSITTASTHEITTSKSELQRRSVISNVSSVTTSGIVSDDRSPLEKSTSEVEDDSLFDSGQPFDPSMTRTVHLLSETRHSSASSELGERAKAVKTQGVQLNNRHSAAISETSSHRSGPDGITLFQLNDHSHLRDACVSSVSSSNRHSRNSELSDDDGRRGTEGSQSSGSRPSSRHLTQMIQAEIAGKDVHTPLLSALCNDHSLLMMQQQQQEEYEDDTHISVYEESCRTLSNQSSMLEVHCASQDLNVSATTLVSHGSMDSDLHENHHANSSSLIIISDSASTVGQDDYPTGLLTKHQTLNTLNDLGDSRRYESRLPFGGEGGSEGRKKCQTLPCKINASGEMLLMGRTQTDIKEEHVSSSAPNLSPGATHNEIPILLS